MDKNHITVERLLYDPVTAANTYVTALKFYTPQKCTRIEREWGPDTLKLSTAISQK